MPQEMPKRTLGRTGEAISVVGLGGIAIMRSGQNAANNFVAEAWDHGVTYFDVAPQYGEGLAEERMGPALKPYRAQSFLACKSAKRDAKGCRAELERSLRRLQTDYFDLYQLHGIKDLQEDVEPALAPGGALEVLLEAKQKGYARFIGFSAHSPEAALRAMQTGHFDTILYPINFTCHFRSEFDQKPLEVAKEMGMGILALKAMAREKWPEDLPKNERPTKTWYQPITDPQIAELAIRWTLNQGACSIIPPGEMDLARIAFKAHDKEKPLTPEEEAILNDLSRQLQPIF